MVAFGSALEELIENYRLDIQFEGRFDPDSRNEVKKIHEINEIDESPFEVHEIYFENTKLVADPPLAFEVHYDRNDAIYDVSGDFEIQAFDHSRNIAIELVREMLEVFWKHYAIVDPETLTESAQRLQRELRSRFNG